MALEITGENFDALLDEKEVVVVDFWAPWCGPCRMLGPIVEQISEENNDDSVAVVKMNVDEEGELATKYAVRSIPTIVYIKNGEVVKRTVGVQAKGDIEKSIEELK